MKHPASALRSWAYLTSLRASTLSSTDSYGLSPTCCDQVPFLPASQAAYAMIQAAVERESGTSTERASLSR
jgi:hypothetical protein